MNKEALFLAKDAVARAKLEHRKDWLDMKDEHNFEGSGETLRKHGAAFKWLEDNGIIDFSKIQEKDYEVPSYKETTEIIKDGQQKSDRLIEMSESDMKDEEYILKAHGYDPNIWEIVNAKNSIFNVNAKGGITKTLYSSKITVKKKADGMNVDKLIERLKESMKPIKVKRPEAVGKRLLVLPFVDMHFGINTFEYYEEKLAETVEKIQMRTWDTIYVPIGHDLLHNNNHQGTTVSGTNIEKVDMDRAWNDAFKFYKVIFTEALKHANNVVSDYVPGNHDADISWGFMKGLPNVFEDVKFNTDPDNKKIFKWEKVFIISLHGDKGMARVVKTLLTKYRDLITGCKVVEVQSGHLHSEKVKDDFGIVTRTLPTSAQEDDWHVEESFEGAVKTSQIFEYSEDKLKTIYHV